MGEQKSSGEGKSSGEQKSYGKRMSSGEQKSSREQKSSGEQKSGEQKSSKEQKSGEQKSGKRKSFSQKSSSSNLIFQAGELKKSIAVSNLSFNLKNSPTQFKPFVHIFPLWVNLTRKIIVHTALLKKSWSSEKQFCP